MHTTCDDSRYMYSPIEAALKVLNDIYSRKKLIGDAAPVQAHGCLARAPGRNRRFSRLPGGRRKRVATRKMHRKKISFACSSIMQFYKDSIAHYVNIYN